MSVHETWLKYNECANNLKELLGGANTNVGGYAEYLCARHYGGEILGNSHPSADIKTPNGTLYQVKARKITGTKSTQLSVIRSWDFDYLIVILFDKKGGIQCAIEMSAATAKNYGKENSHQNGWVITTTQKFLNAGKDIRNQIIRAVA